MNIIVSWVLVTVLIVSGIALVFLTATPAMERSRLALEMQDAEKALKGLVNAINAIADEGNGSSRTANLPKGEWNKHGNTIEYKIAADSMEPFTRNVDAIEKISGSDAKCGEESDAWIMENSLLRTKLRKQNGQVSSDNIMEIYSKATGIRIASQDSSIIINNNPSTKTGTGTSEIIINSPAKCVIQYHIDTAADISYDIFYTLYSGADFIAVEVENVKSKMQ